MAEEKGLLGKIWYLKKINLLQGLQGAQMEELATSCTMKEFAKKETIYSPVDDQEYIYFLKKGMVRIYKLDPSGKEITFSLLGMGESFGALSPGAEEEGGEEFAQALEPTLVCFIPKKRLLAMIQKNPYLNLKVSKLLGLRLIEVQILLEDLVFKSVLQRVASLLLRLYKKFGKEDDIGTFATSVELIQIQSNLSNKKSSMGVKENDISNFNSINSFNNFNNLDVTNPDESNIRDKQDGEGINNVF